MRRWRCCFACILHNNIFFVHFFPHRCCCRIFSVTIYMTRTFARDKASVLFAFIAVCFYFVVISLLCALLPLLLFIYLVISPSLSFSSLSTYLLFSISLVRLWQFFCPTAAICSCAPFYFPYFSTIFIFRCYIVSSFVHYSHFLFFSLAIFCKNFFFFIFFALEYPCIKVESMYAKSRYYYFSWIYWFSFSSFCFFLCSVPRRRMYILCCFHFAY